MDSNYTNASNPYLEHAVNQSHLYSSSEELIFQNIYVMVICVCIFTTGVHALVLVVLKRCRKMPTALKWLSFNFVACNMVHYIANASMTILFLSLDAAYRSVVFDLRLIMAAVTYCVGCGMTSGLALERYIKLTYPYKFNRILSNLNVALYIVSVWVISIGVPLGIVGQHFVMTCKSTLWMCDFSGSVINKITSFCIVVILLFTLLTTLTVFEIKKQVHKQIVKIAKSNQVQPLDKDTLTTVNTVPDEVFHIHVIPNTSHAEQRSNDVPRNMLDTTESDLVINILPDEDKLKIRTSQSSVTFVNTITASNSNDVRGHDQRNDTTDISHEQRDKSRKGNLSNKIACSIPSKSQQKYDSRNIQRSTSMSLKSQKKKSNENIKNSNFRATQNTLRIIISYVVVQVLITSASAFIRLFPEWQTPSAKTYIQTLCFICVVAGSYIALYLYVWQFRECKMLFLITFCSWNSRLYEHGNQIKLDVYNIVITDIHRRKRESSI